MNHRAEQFLFAFLCGCAFTLTLCMLGEDLLHSSPKQEKRSCVDRPDTRAFMARDPGSPHTTEACLQAIRFGDPRWVPELTNPLGPKYPMRMEGQ